MEIRRARAEDAEAILEYCKVIGGETDNLTFGAEGVSSTVEAERDYLESIADSRTQLFLVAVEDGCIVGTSNLSCFTKSRLAHRGEIALSVRKSLWGRGIGTQLLEAVFRFARQTAQVELLSLEVRSDNARAISLYKKFGFEKIGTFRGFMKIHGQPVDCDIMQVHL